MLQAVLMTPGTMPIWNVILLGMGIVFLGLICIVILCTIMGKVMTLLGKAEDRPSAPVEEAAAPAVIPNRQELVAAVSCCLAEELGTDVTAIRILSIKKI